MGDRSAHNFHGVFSSVYKVKTLLHISAPRANEQHGGPHDIVVGIFNVSH